MSKAYFRNDYAARAKTQGPKSGPGFHWEETTWESKETKVLQTLRWALNGPRAQEGGQLFTTPKAQSPGQPGPGTHIRSLPGLYLSDPNSYWLVFTFMPD